MKKNDYQVKEFDWKNKQSITEKKEITNLSLKVSGLITNKINMDKSEEINSKSN